MIEEKIINSTEKLITEIRKDYASWDTTTFPWFRGEPENVKDPLLPRLYRETEDGRVHEENKLLQQFRMKAPSLGLINTPPREETDKWLFLAQHVGLPTRLLDWTEGLFVALHFALLEEMPVVWMLDPIELNRRTTISSDDDNVFSLTWFSKDQTLITRLEMVKILEIFLQDESEKVTEDLEAIKQQLMEVNIGYINIRGAWEVDKVGTKLPIAIHPTSTHPRMHAQRSCFTIQGRDKTSLAKLVDDRVLRKYVIPKEDTQQMRGDMHMMGITYSTVFPDLDNLAKDLSAIF